MFRRQVTKPGCWCIRAGYHKSWCPFPSLIGYWIISSYSVMNPAHRTACSSLHTRRQRHLSEYFIVASLLNLSPTLAPGWYRSPVLCQGQPAAQDMHAESQCSNSSYASRQVSTKQDAVINATRIHLDEFNSKWLDHQMLNIVARAKDLSLMQHNPAEIKYQAPVPIFCTRPKSNGIIITNTNPQTSN